VAGNRQFFSRGKIAGLPGISDETLKEAQRQYELMIGMQEALSEYYNEQYQTTGKSSV